MSEKFDQLKIMQEMFPNAIFVDANGERVADTSKTIDHIADVSKKVSLTELWKKGKIKKAKYWVKYRNGNIDIWELSEGITIESKPEIIEVLAPVPSWDKWLESESHCAVYSEVNKGLKEKLEPFSDPYFKSLTTKDISELAKKSIRLTKQHCKDNERIEKLEELLKECKDFVGLAGYLSLDTADDNTVEKCNKLLTKIDEVLK